MWYSWISKHKVMGYDGIEVLIQTETFIFGNFMAIVYAIVYVSRSTNQWH